MRLVFLNRFYWPDEPATAQLLTDLAEALAHRGHEIVVITSHPGTAAVARDEIHHAVRILRIRTPRHALPGVAGKALAYATFFCGALWRALLVARRGDTLVALTDPPLIGIGAALVAGLRRTRLFHWVQDIYPEVAIELAGQRWLRVLLPLRNLAWRRADACFVLGSDMAEVLLRSGVPATKLHPSPNWAPLGLTAQPPSAAARLRTQWGLEGKFVVAYSGNLGRVHDLHPILAVATALRDDPQIAFVFIGSGAQRASLQAEAHRLGLTHVHFHPPQPRDSLATALALGDVHLVTLLPGCEHLVFPSKLYGVTAVGRPVIVVGPANCELATLVTSRGFGRAFTRDQTTALATTLRELRDDDALRSRWAAAALAFAADHSGPAPAALRWETALTRSTLAAPFAA